MGGGYTSVLALNPREAQTDRSTQIRVIALPIRNDAENDRIRVLSSSHVYFGMAAVDANVRPELGAAAPRPIQLSQPSNAAMEKQFPILKFEKAIAMSDSVAKPKTNRLRFERSALFFRTSLYRANPSDLSI